MDHFRTREGSLFVEDFPISQLASLYGSPCYVYSKAILTQNFLNFHNALGSHPHRICYAVKANGALALLQTLNQLGAGFDIVSEGELARVQKATFKTNHIIFSGVGKTKTELQAALLAKIFCFNIESEDELMCLQKLAQDKNQKAPISFRINPNVDAKSHPFLSTGNLESKFGIPIDTAPSLYLKAKSLSHIEIKGIACHIGSQITTLLPFLDALDKLLALKNTLAQHNIHITHLNLGGGLGVPYTKESPPTILDYTQSIFEKVKTYKDLEIIIEPGRAIVANAGILITQVIRTKTH
ncbi:MAG TPA: diaminopimelate decarboxylase, partial [Gammaproteobacteria bacterium]|nr:diaminopimelate decarboxylase [Gammaproteobacteria bacterium]